MVPQVLFGLGLAGLASGGIFLWMHRLQPLFAVVAVVSLVYAHWMMWSRRRRGESIERAGSVIVWLSTLVNATVFIAAAWMWLH